MFKPEDAGREGFMVTPSSLIESGVAIFGAQVGTVGEQWVSITTHAGPMFMVARDTGVAYDIGGHRTHPRFVFDHDVARAFGARIKLEERVEKIAANAWRLRLAALSVPELLNLHALLTKVEPK